MTSTAIFLRPPAGFDIETPHVKLTAKGRYAVTATAALAARGPGARVSLPELSREHGIPLAFLEQVMGKLRRAGLVESARGSAGGYSLAVDPAELHVSRVIEAVDIDIRAQGCTPDMKTACAGQGTKCLTHDLWHALEGHIGGFLASVTVADVVAGRVGEMA